MASGNVCGRPPTYLWALGNLFILNCNTWDLHWGVIKHIHAFLHSTGRWQNVCSGVWHLIVCLNHWHEKNGEMSICWQHCGSANSRYTTVGISWHQGKRQAADREIISARAGAQWMLSTAAVMLLRERGLRGLLRETFTDILKIKEQIIF